MQHVADILGQIISGSLNHEDLLHIHSLLMEGIDITALFL